MSFFKKLFGKSEEKGPHLTRVSSPPNDPAEDPNLIKVFDKYGQEMFITRDGAMSVSKHWKDTTFGAVVENFPITHKKLPKRQYSEAGRFPVVDQGQQFIGGYSDDEDKAIKDDLPLLVFGDHTRAFKYLNEPFVPGADGIKVLKPIGVDARWLYQIAHAVEFPDKGYSRHFQHLKKARLMVPPIDEQRLIVAEVEKQ